MNDSVNQTQFLIHTIYQPTGRIAIQTSKPVTNINDYTDVLNARAIAWGKTEGGNIYENVTTNGAGNLSIGIADPRTAFGEVETIQPTAISQLEFTYGINTVISVSNLSSNATITSTGGLLSVTSNGATHASAAFLAPKKMLTYRSGQGSLTRITGKFSYGSAGSIQVMGTGFFLANTTYTVDCQGFGYNGTSFGIFWRNNGSDNWVPQASWNQDTCLGGTKSGFVLNPQFVNMYQLRFQYAGNMFFYVMNSFNGRWILVHLVKNTGTLSGPEFQNPTMQAIWYSNCTTSSNTVTVSGLSCSQFIEGTRSFTGSKGGFQNTNSSITNNTQTMLFALHNAVYFGNTQNNVIINHGQVHVRSISFAGNGIYNQGNNYYQPSGVVTLTLIRNPTVGPVNFTPYSGTNQSGSDGSNIYGQSFLSSNITPMTTISGGNVGFCQVISIGASSGPIDLSPYEIVLYPGDTLCFMANVQTSTSQSTYVASASVTWNEDQ